MPRCLRTSLQQCPESHEGPAKCLTIPLQNLLEVPSRSVDLLRNLVLNEYPTCQRNMEQ